MCHNSKPHTDFYQGRLLRLATMGLSILALNRWQAKILLFHPARHLSVPLFAMAYLNTITTDLIYHIMLRIHGRDDLLSFILSCHCVHETFKEHPNSILRRVVCNEFNMRTDALSLAWEVAGLQQMVESGHAGQRAISDDTAFTASEYKCLGRNHAVISSLAKKFSIQLSPAINATLFMLTSF
jgi:hypothetical protein